MTPDSSRRGSVLWIGRPLRYGPWRMSRWAEWAHAFDVGPVRVLWGWRHPLERDAAIRVHNERVKAYVNDLGWDL